MEASREAGPAVQYLPEVLQSKRKLAIIQRTRAIADAAEKAQMRFFNRQAEPAGVQRMCDFCEVRRICGPQR